jgi:hypothetical protein
MRLWALPAAARILLSYRAGGEENQTVINSHAMLTATGRRGIVAGQRNI